MPSASRAAKTLGNTTFAAEVAAGQRFAKAIEVDADLDILYDIINRLDAANLADLAVTTAKLAAGAVTAAKIAAGTITAAQIAAAAGILGSQLANTTISVGKLGFQASISAIASNLQNGLSAGFTSSEVEIFTVAITPRFSRVAIQAHLSGSFSVIGDGNARIVNALVYRGAAPGGVGLGAQQCQAVQPTGLAGSISFPFSLPLVIEDTAATAGIANTYSIRVAGSLGVTGVVQAAYLHLLERA